MIRLSSCRKRSDSPCDWKKDSTGQQMAMQECSAYRNLLIARLLDLWCLSRTRDFFGFLNGTIKLSSVFGDSAKISKFPCAFWSVLRCKEGGGENDPCRFLSQHRSSVPFDVLGVIMFKRGLGFLAGLALLSSGLIASELAVQGSSTTGGDAGTIRGRIGGEVRFSVTGAFNDSATVTFQGGSFRLTVRELWNLPANHPTIQLVDRVQLPDGQSRVLLRVRNGDRRFNGGSVALRRGTVLLDSDPIVLH